MSRARCAPPSCSAASAIAATSRVLASTAPASPGAPISRAAGTESNSSLASFLVWSSVGSTRRFSPPASASTAEQRQPGAGGGHHQDQVCGVPVQHEALVPVQDSSRRPVRAAARRGEPDRLGIPRSVVLGEGQRGHGLAGGDARQQLAPGRLIGSGQQRRGREHRAGQVRPAVQRGAKLLQDDGLLGEGEPGAAVLLGDRDPLQAELGPGLLPDLPGRSRPASPSARGPGTAAPGRPGTGARHRAVPAAQSLMASFMVPAPICRRLPLRPARRRGPAGPR